MNPIEYLENIYNSLLQGSLKLINAENKRYINSITMGVLNLENPTEEQLRMMELILKISNILYNNCSEQYLVLEDGTYKEYKDNLKIKTKIFENEINILKQYKNELYYLEKDTLFIYKPETGSKKVFYNYELEFNSNNSTFIYIK